MNIMIINLILQTYRSKVDLEYTRSTKYSLDNIYCIYLYFSYIL